MSNPREECYKCLYNKKCSYGANYGSTYCKLNRKYKEINKKKESNTNENTKK